MTTPSILSQIDYIKQRTAAIRAHESCSEVHWQIRDLQPEQILELEKHYGLNWFRNGNMMCLLMYNLAEGWHITLYSVPVEIRQQFEYIKQLT